MATRGQRDEGIVDCLSLRRDVMDLDLMIAIRGLIGLGDMVDKMVDKNWGLVRACEEEIGQRGKQDDRG